ncbi:MAG: hypothetical protein KDD64_01775 [Bdellovibrionales bacterium]|nr:hypothetical protein [Bdellovibrionales bacterium]
MNTAPKSLIAEVKSNWILLLLTLVVAACSIGYELLIAQSLALLASNGVIWYSVVIGCFLLGLGLGSFCADILMKKVGELDPAIWRKLVLVELLLSVAGFLAVPTLHGAHSVYSFLDYWNYTNIGLTLFFGTALGATLFIGLLTGIELPFLIEAGKHSSPQPRTTNLVLAFDYFGSLVGGLLFALYLVPNFSTLFIGTAIASINLAAAMAIAALFCRKKVFLRAVTIGAALMTAYGSVFLYQAGIEQFFLKRFYCYRLLSRSLSHFFSLGNEYPDILRVRSPYQRIDLLHDMEGDGTDPFVQGISSKFTQNPDWPHNYLLFLNGDWQFHSNHEEVYHEWFAHVPIINTGRVPKNVLVLGGGDGLLIRELLRYPEIQTITHIDLDRALIELASTNEIFLRLNGGALSDSRVKRVITDGLQFVRKSRESFDAVYIDFPTPTDYDLSKLYSREFYTFVRRRLTPTGYMVFDSVSTGAFSAPDANGNQAFRDDNRWLDFANTLNAAGFTRLVPFNSFLGFDQSKAIEMAKSAYSAEDAAFRLQVYVLQRQQGFIMAGLPGTLFGHPYRKPPGHDLYALNDLRYKLSFKAQYPMPEKINYSLVNSVFRPRLAIMPIWYARLPF